MNHLMGLYNEQTNNGSCWALCLLVCMHVCIRTTQYFSLHSATVDSDFRSLIQISLSFSGSSSRVIKAGLST